MRAEIAHPPAALQSTFRSFGIGTCSRFSRLRMFLSANRRPLRRNMRWAQDWAMKIYLAGPFGFSEAGRAFHDGTIVCEIARLGHVPLDPWPMHLAEPEL